MPGKSLRERILEPAQEALEKLDVPEWGESVWLRKLSGMGQDRWQTSLMKGDGLSSAALVQDTACDESGKRLFVPNDMPQIAQLPFRGIKRIVDRVLESNAITGDAIEEAKGN
jgi:hypothetical protein